jgi:hypothetical protein
MDASPTLYQPSDPGISAGKRALKKHAIPKTWNASEIKSREDSQNNTAMQT